MAADWKQLWPLLPVGLPFLHTVDHMGAASGMLGQRNDARTGAPRPPRYALLLEKTNGDCMYS